MENSLTESQKATLFDQFRRATPTDCFWLFSADWDELVFISGEYERLFGRSLDALERDPTDFLQGVHPEDRPEVRSKMETATEGEAVEIEFRVNPDEEYARWVKAHGVPVREKGELTRIAGFTREITERKRRERELERQNERLEKFARVVSHDLRNPLNVAEGRLDMARQDCDSEHLEVVASELDRMESLVEDLLTLAQQGRPVEDAVPVDLDDLARESWDHVRTYDASLTVETDRTIPADRSQLRQLLENCFRNSVEHGGTDVSVTVGDVDSGFYVADDRCGFPEQDGDQMFESGYTTSVSGTGLGLAIVEEVAEAHDWTVRATESEAGGARIEIRDTEAV
ncbi:MAG: PAS domain-containing sensor histidine kinase [Halopenitus sp.]